MTPESARSSTSPPPPTARPLPTLFAEIAGARGLDVRQSHFRIPDLDVVDDHQYDEVAQILEDGLPRGAVYVQCWGGIGRTGTVIGCVLDDEGLVYDAIIERLTPFAPPAAKRIGAPRRWSSTSSSSAGSHAAG